MKDQEIIDTVADTFHDTKINSRILGWCNAFVAYLSREYIFQHLSVTAATINIVNGTNTYPVPSVAFLKNVWLPERRLISIEEEYGGEDELTRINPLWNTQTGIVTHYLFAGGELIFIKVPDVDDTAYHSYQKYADALVDGKNTEYTGFPSDVHLLIQYYAEMQGFKRSGQRDLYANSLVEYQSMKRALKLKLYKRPDVRYPMLGTRRYQGMAPAIIDRDEPYV